MNKIKFMKQNEYTDNEGKLDHLLDDLNEEQKKAVINTDGPLLIVAGAGTGKTFVLTRKIAYLINKGKAYPKEILALTFTDKAANEMQERIDVFLPYSFNDVNISTFHSFGNSIIKEHSFELGLAPSYQILSQPDQIVFLSDNIENLPLERYKPLSSPVKYIPAIVQVISRAKDENISCYEYDDFVKKLYKRVNTVKRKKILNEEDKKFLDEYEKHAEIARVYLKYEELKAKQNFIDYGDLIILVIKLFKEHPSILDKYRNLYKYILIDEFQDTNYSQFILARMLSEKTRNITVVCDDDQSIFKFRGACLSNVLKFKEIYPDAKVFILTKNYRSTQHILDTAYRLIQFNNPDRLEIKEKIPKKLEAVNPSKKISVVYLHFDTLQTESDTVARMIRDEVIKNGMKFSDFAILVRRNDDADEFLKSLNYYGIPWTFSGNKGLYNCQDIQRLLAFLRVISDPLDSVSLHHLAVSDYYGCDPYEIAKINKVAKYHNWTLFELFEELVSGTGKVFAYLDKVPSQTFDKIKLIVSDIRKYSKQSAEMSTNELLYNFLKDKGVIRNLMDSKEIKDIQKAQNIAKFYKIVERISQITKYNRVMEFVDYINKLIDAGDDPSQSELVYEEDRVNVLTVHKAKGLEFHTVFMVGLVEDRFPSKERSDTIELPEELLKEIQVSGDYHLQEERRLFYVGLTRAKEKVYLTCADDYGTKRKRKISRFIIEALDIPPLKDKIIAEPLEVIERYGKKSQDKTSSFKINNDFHLSTYAIDDYLTCPYKYKLVHILKVPIIRYHAVVFGSVIHDTLTEYSREKMKGREVTLKKLFEIYNSFWQSSGFISKEHEESYKEKGRKMLEKYFHYNEKTGVIPISVEEEFEFKIDNIRVVGKWDRLDKRGDKYVIVDYKTSTGYDTKKKADAEAKKSRQLAIYSLGFEKKYSIILSHLELHFLENCIIGVAVPDEKIKKDTVEEIKKVYEGIQKQIFDATPSYIGCFYCAYESICPAKSI